MALVPSTEPWTAAVAWARPWRRPLPHRPSAAVPRVVRPSAVPGPAVTPSDPRQEAAWSEGVAELRAALEALAGVDSAHDAGVDDWLEILARQDVLRARRKLRQVQEALTGADADLPWSSC